MTAIEDCAAQVIDNFNSGKCPNRFFEHDPSDGDCDCCADELFDSSSYYDVYEVVGGGQGGYQPYDDGSGVNNACTNDVELTSMTNIDDCAAQVASEFASGKCPNRFFEHDPTDGDCDCCADEAFNNPTSDYGLYELTGTPVQKPTTSGYSLYDTGSSANACANDVELTSMTNIDDCAAQVASEFASGKCPNKFFEHDPTDGDCDCCADEQFDNPTSNYSLYQLETGSSFSEFKMGFYCSSQSGHGLTNYSSIEECAAAAADKFADGTCTNSQGLIEYDHNDGDCNCCVDGTSFTSSSYYDIY
jgi:hypothetical protein